MEWLAWIGQSAPFAWLRESGSIFAYPTILFLHTIGMALIVGLNAALDLRLLGVAPAVPLAPLGRLFPYMWIGLGINVLSGGVLLFLEVESTLANPVFYAKMAFIGLALNNLRLIRARAFGGAGTAGAPGIRLLAFTSLVFWAAAITGGRLMAYLAPLAIP